MEESKYTVNRLLNENLGMVGRMISGSKSGYIHNNPLNVAVFNANVVIKQSGNLFRKPKYSKVWYGDIDVTKDESFLVAAAKEAGCELYVLREMDARFDKEDKPNIKDFVLHTDGDKSEIGPGIYGATKRNENGQIILDR